MKIKYLTAIILTIMMIVLVPGTVFAGSLGEGADQAQVPLQTDEQQASRLLPSIELRNVQTAVMLYQLENNGSLPTIAGFPVAAQMDEYLLGGVTRLHGTYILAASGIVTQATFH